MKLLQLFFAAIPLFFVFSAYSQNRPNDVGTDG